MEGGHVDVAKLLLERGAVMNKPNNDDIYPIHHAATSGQTEIVEILAKSMYFINCKIFPVFKIA